MSQIKKDVAKPSEAPQSTLRELRAKVERLESELRKAQMRIETLEEENDELREAAKSPVNPEDLLS